MGLALLVGLVAWLVTRGGGDDEGAQVAAGPAVQVLGESEISEAVSGLSDPVYWAGPQGDEDLEFEDLGEGAGFRIRYVPEGSEPGEASGEVLTIGTYPLPDPAQALEEFAEQPGAVVREADDGTEVVSSEKRPTSVYFVDPGNTVQVEVYDSDPERAMTLALSGNVRPVD